VPIHCIKRAVEQPKYDLDAVGHEYLTSACNTLDQIDDRFGDAYRRFPCPLGDIGNRLDQRVERERATGIRRWERRNAANVVSDILHGLGDDASDIAADIGKYWWFDVLFRGDFQEQAQNAVGSSQVFLTGESAGSWVRWPGQDGWMAN